MDEALDEVELCGCGDVLRFVLEAVAGAYFDEADMVLGGHGVARARSKERIPRSGKDKRESEIG